MQRWCAIKEVIKFKDVLDSIGADLADPQVYGDQVIFPVVARNASPMSSKVRASSRAFGDYMKDLQSIAILSSVKKKSKLVDKMFGGVGKTLERALSSNLKRVFEGKDIPPGYCGVVVLQKAKLKYIPVNILLSFPKFGLDSYVEWHIITDKSGVSIFDNLIFSGNVETTLKTAAEDVRKLEEKMERLKEDVKNLEFEVEKTERKRNTTEISIKCIKHIYNLGGRIFLSPNGVEMIVKKTGGVI